MCWFRRAETSCLPWRPIRHHNPLIQVSHTQPVLVDNLQALPTIPGLQISITRIVRLVNSWTLRNLNSQMNVSCSSSKLDRSRTNSTCTTESKSLMNEMQLFRTSVISLMMRFLLLRWRRQDSKIHAGKCSRPASVLSKIQFKQVEITTCFRFNITKHIIRLPSLKTCAAT